MTVSLLDALREDPERGVMVARNIARAIAALGAPLEQIAEFYGCPVEDVATLEHVGHFLSDEHMREYFAARLPTKEEVTPGQYSREDVRDIFEQHGIPAWNFVMVENPTTGALEPLSDLSLNGRYKTRRADGTWRNPSPKRIGGRYVPGTAKARAHAGRPLADHVVNEVLKLYGQGLPLRVIWSRTAVPPTQILAFTKRAGVFVARPVGKRKKSPAA